jgi:bacteriorhodopsin
MPQSMNVFFASPPSVLAWRRASNSSSYAMKKSAAVPKLQNPHYITAGITGVACIAYFAMGSNLGQTPNQTFHQAS